MNKKIWVAVIVITLGILGVFAWLKLPLWRDTIIRSDEGGIFVTASGKEYPTNRWFSRTEEFSFIRLQSRERGVLIHYLVENIDENQKAKLRFGSSEYHAIVENLFASGGRLLEYTVRPGPKVK